MNLIRSQPQRPLPVRLPLLSCLLLWIAPVGLGLVVLALALPIGRLWAEPGLELALIASALVFSPLYSWIGWLIALPLVMLALWHGWFGWVAALLIGAGCGLVAGALADTEIAFPFGIVALLFLRAMLGRLLPLRQSI